MKIDGTSVTLSRQKNELYQFCIANSYAILYKSLFEKCYYQFARKITINLCAKISHFMRKATPGMVYEGGPLDEALTGCWYGADGRFVLDFEGKCADFLVDGKMLSSKEPGYYFVDHSFSAGDDLNERCELSPFGGPEIKDETYETILTIDEMWYQAEHIYMNITWPDGKPESIIFSKQNDSMPTGEW